MVLIMCLKREISLIHAAIEGLNEEMEKDADSYFLRMENLPCKNSQKSWDLSESVKNRVIDMPKSVATLVSASTGLAMIGMRPVIEFNNSEDFYLSFSALLDQVVKLRYMSGGKLKFPVTYLFIENNDFGPTGSDNPYSFSFFTGE